MRHTNIINKLDELSYKGFKDAYMHQIEDVNYDNPKLCNSENLS